MYNRREIGCVYVYTRDGMAYPLKMEQYESVLAAWKSGKAFWEGEPFHGGMMTIKLAPVEAISRIDPAAMNSYRAEEKAHAAEDALHG